MDEPLRVFPSHGRSRLAVAVELAQGLPLSRMCKELERGRLSRSGLIAALAYAQNELSLLALEIRNLEAGDNG